MINMEITSDEKKVYIKCEVNFEGKRKEAIAEYVCAMRVLKKSDKETFRDALQVLVKEDILDIMDEMDEGGKHDD